MTLPNKPEERKKRRKITYADPFDIGPAREEAIFNAFRQGVDNEQIAASTGVKPHIVKTLRANFLMVQSATQVPLEKRVLDSLKRAEGIKANRKATRMKHIADGTLARKAGSGKKKISVQKAAVVPKMFVPIIEQIVKECRHLKAAQVLQLWRENREDILDMEAQKRKRPLTSKEQEILKDFHERDKPLYEAWLQRRVIEKRRNAN
ncbi:MAG TPA: hypothetical protein VI977_05310 [archaeon]|nr:hypothetical protein [archaeon]